MAHWKLWEMGDIFQLQGIQLLAQEADLGALDVTGLN